MKDASSGIGLERLEKEPLFDVAAIRLDAFWVATSTVTAAVASMLAGASWVFLFHGIFGRMYSLFLFTSLLSFLALLAALDGDRPRRFALWGISLLLVLGSHPYAVLVVGAQALFVLLRRQHLRS